jgi:hypothetical protein
VPEQIAEVLAWSQLEREIEDERLWQLARERWEKGERSDTAMPYEADVGEIELSDEPEEQEAEEPEAREEPVEEPKNGRTLFALSDQIAQALFAAGWIKQADAESVIDVIDETLAKGLLHGAN